MKDFVEIKFSLEGAEIRLETFSWADLREFMDALAPALTAMQDGPAASEMLPVRVEDGSARTVLRVPRASMQSVYRFRDGPTSRWTPEQRFRAGRVYEYLEDKGARLRCGARKLKPVVIPTGRADWRVREQTTLRGTIRRAGGSRGNVEVGFDEGGHVHCRAGRDLAKAMAEHLYRSVWISGVAERDPQTGRVTRFEVEAFRPDERRDLRAGLDELHKVLGDSMEDFDPAGHLREVRG